MTDNTMIVSKLKKLLQDRFAIDPGALTDTTRLTDLGIDSLHVVDILLDVELELGVTFENLSLPPNPNLLDICNEISRSSVKAE
jgi:acyl carrier protein